jgi:hypothetical protein
MTDSWSFTISQRTPWSGLLEVGYLGNKSSNLLSSGASRSLSNINAVPYGALFNYNGDPNNAPYDSFRQYGLYQDLTIAKYIGRANYNALQVTWVRQRGRFNLQLNYTYGKALGTLGNTNDGYDQFNIDNTYGAMPNDRRHIFNAAYSIELGNPVKGNKFGAAIANGWQLSGITQWQSGINLTGNTGGNFNLNTNSAKAVNGYNVSARVINGTESINLRPLVTCDPTANLGPNQYVNGACFSLPTVPGVNGPMILPEIFGPSFLNSDLGMFKNFAMGEQRKIQIRFNAYNFLNHPLWSFVSSGNNLNWVADPNTAQLSNPNFGITTEKQGRRIIQVAIKYYF